MKTHTQVTPPNATDNRYWSTWRITTSPILGDGSPDLCNSDSAEYDYNNSRHAEALAARLAAWANEGKSELRTIAEVRFECALRAGNVVDATLYAWMLEQLGEADA